MERPGLAGFLNSSFLMFKTNNFDLEKNIVVSGFLSNSCHLNFRHISLLTRDCWRKVEWAGIASFPNFSSVIFKANIYGFEKIIVVSGFPSNNRNLLFHQLGEPTKGWCQKIVWQIIESLLNFFFISKTKISQRPRLCCANTDEKLSDCYFSVRYTIFFSKNIKTIREPAKYFKPYGLQVAPTPAILDVFFRKTTYTLRTDQLFFSTLII